MRRRKRFGQLLLTSSLWGFCRNCSFVRAQHKCLNGSAYIFQLERSKLLEGKIKPVLHMIAHCS